MQETYTAAPDGPQLDNPQSKTSPMVLPSILLSTADEPSPELIQGRSLAIEINLLTPQQNERQALELTPKSDHSLFLSPRHEGHLKCVSLSPPHLQLDKDRSESPGLLTPRRWSDNSPLSPLLYENDGDWPVSLLHTQEGSGEANGSITLNVGDLADSINKIQRRLSTSSAGSHRRSNSEDVVVKLLIEEEKARRSMEDIIGKLSELLKNEDGYKHLLSKRGTDAQALVDLFQDLLDGPESMNPTFRRQLIVALQRLCKAANVYPRSYELPEIPFSEQGFVGGGGFGDIYKCQQRETVVCVKVIRLHLASLSDQFMKNFVREAILWGQLFHPNVLPFHGFFRHHSRPCLVSPWMVNGPITDYLKLHPLVDRYHLISDITEGLGYLHSWDIVHGDLKGVNILVDDCGRARLADFGISSIFDTSIPHWTSHSTVASKGGSARWQAPELFDFDSTDDKDVYNTAASDIYAWACVCYEIFTGRLPFFEISKDANVTHKIKTIGLRPSRPPKDSPAWLSWGLDDTFWCVIEACWAEKPLHRPLIDQLLPILRAKVFSDSRPSAQFPRITSEYRRAKRAKPSFPSLHDLERLIGQPQGEDTSTTPVESPSHLDDFRMVVVRESVKRDRDPEEENSSMQEKGGKRPRISSPI